MKYPMITTRKPEKTLEEKFIESKGLQDEFKNFKKQVQIKRKLKEN